MSKFLNFNNLITTSIIKGVYLLGALAITIISFLGMTQDMSGSVFAGLLGLVLGNLMWRVFCENIIVLFSIHDTLSSIDNSIKDSS
ncbi:DUF4282 domain-containing protein [Candidatus Bipolaricaulota bacterium]|nr:DUF4282 domain-containing protein [Candidatus Bipolaricaulota bacterium]